MPGVRPADLQQSLAQLYPWWLNGITEHQCGDIDTTEFQPKCCEHLEHSSIKSAACEGIPRSNPDSVCNSSGEEGSQLPVACCIEGAANCEGGHKFKSCFGADIQNPMGNDSRGQDSAGRCHSCRSHVQSLQEPERLNNSVVQSHSEFHEICITDRGCTGCSYADIQGATSPQAPELHINALPDVTTTLQSPEISISGCCCAFRSAECHQQVLGAGCSAYRGPISARSPQVNAIAHFNISHVNSDKCNSSSGSSSTEAPETWRLSCINESNTCSIAAGEGSICLSMCGNASSRVSGHYYVCCHGACEVDNTEGYGAFDDLLQFGLLPGSTNIDIGGGPFDANTIYLLERLAQTLHFRIILGCCIFYAWQCQRVFLAEGVQFLIGLSNCL